MKYKLISYTTSMGFDFIVEAKKNLIQVRQKFANREYINGNEQRKQLLNETEQTKLEGYLKNLKLEISQQGNSQEEVISLYYTIKLFLKASKMYKYIYSNQKENIPKPKALFLIFDDNNNILLQRRGLYKLQFPGVLSISASGDLKDSDESAQVLSIIEKETNLQNLQATSLRAFQDELPGYNKSYEFQALTNEEAQKLKELSVNMQEYPGVYINYNEAKRSVSIYILNKAYNEVVALDKLKSKLETETEIPAIHPIECEFMNKLFVYKVSDAEKQSLEELIKEKNRNFDSAKSNIGLPSFNEGDLKSLDEDIPSFIGLNETIGEWKRQKEAFAQDLVFPVFANRDLLARIFNNNSENSLMVNAESFECSNNSLVGGKGLNLSRLLWISSFMPHIKVPKTFILTTNLYDKYIKQNEIIQKKMDQINNNNIDLIQGLSELKELIKAIKFDEQDRDQINRIFDEITKGKQIKTIAIRSSATVEDGNKKSAAGLANSFLSVNKKDVFDNIKGVWASFFNEGFFKERTGISSAIDAKMAVILMEMVEARSAATVHTIFSDKAIRNVFVIEGNFGFGESVVDGKGSSCDSWQVSPDAGYILEKEIAEKKSKVVNDKNGGTITKEIDKNESKAESFSDIEVKLITENSRNIRDLYKSLFHITELDLELAINSQRDMIFLQARPITTANTSEKTKEINIIDSKTIPENIECIKISGTGANQGFTMGRLQVLKQSEYDKAERGAIVLTDYTNNQWNAAFHQIRGVLALSGTYTGHTATYSRERGIPSMINIKEEDFLGLKKFDNSFIIIDTFQGLILLVPPTLVEKVKEASSFDANNQASVDITPYGLLTKTITVPDNMWLHEVDDLIKSAKDHQKKLDFIDTNYRYILGKLGMKQYILHDKDGHWYRKQANDSLGVFQVGIYDQGWSRLVNRLNSYAEGKEVLTERIRKVYKGYLYEQMTDDSSVSIINFYKRINDLEFFRQTLEEQKLFFDELIKNLNSTYIHQPIRAILNTFIELVAWLHLYFYQTTAFEATFEGIQSRYISEGYQEIIRVGLTPLGENSLQQNYSKSLSGLREEITKAQALNGLFERNEVEGIFSELQSKHKEFFQKIVDSSQKFKVESEDIRKDSIFFVMRWIATLKKFLENTTTPNIDSSIHELLNNFPQLKDVYTLYQKMLNNREEGHHLIVRLQVLIHELMIQKANKRNDIFNGNKENIFELHREEVIAVFETEHSDPSAIILKDLLDKTLTRRKLHQEADSYLPVSDIAPADDINYEKHIESMKGVVNILKTQIDMSSNFMNLQNHYKDELNTIIEQLLRYNHFLSGMQITDKSIKEFIIKELGLQEKHLSASFDLIKEDLLKFLEYHEEFEGNK